MAYICDAGDGMQAVLIITDLTDGSTIALCGAHVPSYIDSMYHSFADAGVYDAPAEQASTPPDGESGGDAAASDAPGPVTPSDATPPPPRPKRTGKGKAGSGAPTPAPDAAAGVTGQDALPF